MIKVRALEARRAPIAIRDVTLTFDAGVHAILGAREDGAELLLAAIAGHARVHRGEVRILDHVATDESTRRAIAYVPRDVTLPDALTVHESLELASILRHESAVDPRSRLEVFGIAALAPRRVATLTLEEARAVAVTEALTSSARVVLIDEPFVRLDPRAAVQLPAKIQARARDGATILFATASTRDARDLADDATVLSRGALLHGTAIPTSLPAYPGRARFSAVASDTRALVEALTNEISLEAIETRNGVLLVEAHDVIELASAIARAAVRANVEIYDLRASDPSAPT